MPKLNVHKRTLGTDHGGRVFFCCHPDDVASAEHIIDDVLAISDCIAAIDGEPHGEENADWESILSDMQLFVVAVSGSFLNKPSRARDLELALAKEKHVPILPILTESISLSEYNKIFPDVQYLDPNDNSDAALPYKQKLERALGEVLHNSSARARIRESFDRSFFLSYRKKDRRHAQALLEKIHSREQFRATAIWYDEFLLPGEDFNNSIENAMDESSLFLMSVTPNMLEPSNYVLDVEFPRAQEKNIEILAVETQNTDKGEFCEKFKNAPPLIPIEDDEKLFSALDDIFCVHETVNKNTAERTYYLGLAYLGGISVEVNRPLGVQLIKDAAESGYTPALHKLIDMYRCADGVERNYAEVIRLKNLEIEKLFDAFIAEHSAESFEEYLSALHNLGKEYIKLGDYDSARRVILKTKTEADRLRDARHLTEVGKSYICMATLTLASVERLAGNVDEAIMIMKSNLPFFRFELEESDSDEDRRALAVLLQELANLYAQKGNTAKSEKFANEAIAINEELLRSSESSALNRYNLGINIFNKAIGLGEKNDHEGAVQACFQAMDIVSSAMEHHESYALYVRLHLLLGEQYIELGNLDEARSAFAQAIDICESPEVPADIVTLKLKAESMMKLGQLNISLNDVMGARRYLRGADTLFEELITQFGEKIHYARRARIAFLDAQICSAQCLFSGAKYNYEKCIEYMEECSEDNPKNEDLHILALASYMLGNMNRSAPDIPLLQKAFTLWSELCEKEGGEKYGNYRNEVASILVRHMFG